MSTGFGQGVVGPGRGQYRGEYCRPETRREPCGWVKAQLGSGCNRKRIGGGPGSVRAQPWIALSCEVLRPRPRSRESHPGNRIAGRALRMFALVAAVDFIADAHPGGKRHITRVPALERSI